MKTAMIRLLLPLALVFATWLPAHAVEPKAKIEGPTSVPFGQPFVLTAEGSTSEPGFPLTWSIRDGKKATLVTFDKDGAKGYALFVKSAEPGEYVFRLKVKGLSTYTVDGKPQSLVDTDIEDHRVVVGTVKPIDPPAPPGPTPTPTPATVGNLRVLFLYETSANLTAEQLATMNSPDIRGYLNAKTLKDGNSAYRYWDRNIDISEETPGWQSAYTAAKAMTITSPRVLFFAGTAFVKSEPLPPTEAATLELLKKYGGE